MLHSLLYCVCSLLSLRMMPKRVPLASPSTFQEQVTTHIRKQKMGVKTWVSSAWRSYLFHARSGWCTKQRQSKKRKQTGSTGPTRVCNHVTRLILLLPRRRLLNRRLPNPLTP
uniref:Secreted protein n=1 Tax=Utricularia reniformis TaxID=192314 RepID=A0A1Y0B0Z3_9LAMI|nr:hypothetical protein AEK19_MT0823 [Utricularia reniformis]YP_009382315.1 hypothetical protein AEK19_MT1887 [Utricularia reniformis]ART31057.1 hypothetical protein AEK19_MT0823 [Utricularia reniformis]ART32055.1 hypothetical protein AEK19_MT1887 [Utricularia reniformis]